MQSPVSLPVEMFLQVASSSFDYPLWTFHLSKFVSVESKRAFVRATCHCRFRAPFSVIGTLFTVLNAFYLGRV